MIMMYLILPKSGEAQLWGLSAEEVMVILSPEDATRRYKQTDFKSHVDEESPIPSPSASSVVCYSDYSADKQARPGYRAAVCGLLAGEHRVFRHFGSQSLASLNVVEMQKQMRGDDDKQFWKEEHVMPYSEVGNEVLFKWLPKIRSVRDDCFKSSKLSAADAIRSLDEAWSLAQWYYNAQEPMRAMLEALFPLYLVLSGGESIEDEDKTAAIDAANTVINSDAFVPVILDVRSNVGNPSEGARLSSDLRLPLPAQKDFTEFLTWFKELSRAYTKELGLPQAGNPFGS
jgi:hypothetical protein